MMSPWSPSTNSLPIYAEAMAQDEEDSFASSSFQVSFKRSRDVRRPKCIFIDDEADED
jgi:hypothetical protein